MWEGGIFLGKNCDLQLMIFIANSRFIFLSLKIQIFNLNKDGLSSLVETTLFNAAAFAVGFFFAVTEQLNKSVGQL